MRFRTTSQPQTSITVSQHKESQKRTLKRPQRHLKTISTSEGLKKYIQSFMAWMKLQNPRFDRMPSEELTNFFINEFEHPLFFQILLKIETFTVLTEVNQYLENYKNQAELMAIELPIAMLNPPDGIEEYTGKWELAIHDEKALGQSYCKQWGLSMPSIYTAIDHSLTQNMRTE